MVSNAALQWCSDGVCLTARCYSAQPGPARLPINYFTNQLSAEHEKPLTGSQAAVATPLTIRPFRHTDLIWYDRRVKLKQE